MNLSSPGSLPLSKYNYFGMASLKQHCTCCLDQLICPEDAARKLCIDCCAEHTTCIQGIQSDVLAIKEHGIRSISCIFKRILNFRLHDGFIPSFLVSLMLQHEGICKLKSDHLFHLDSILEMASDSQRQKTESFCKVVLKSCTHSPSGFQQFSFYLGTKRRLNKILWSSRFFEKMIVGFDTILEEFHNFMKEAVDPCYLEEGEIRQLSMFADIQVTDGFVDEEQVDFEQESVKESEEEQEYLEQIPEEEQESPEQIPEEEQESPEQISEEEQESPEQISEEEQEYPEKISEEEQEAFEQKSDQKSEEEQQDSEHESEQEPYDSEQVSEHESEQEPYDSEQEYEQEKENSKHESEQEPYDSEQEYEQEKENSKQESEQEPYDSEQEYEQEKENSKQESEQEKEDSRQEARGALGLKDVIRVLKGNFSLSNKITNQRSVNEDIKEYVKHDEWINYKGLITTFYKYVPQRLQQGTFNFYGSSFWDYVAKNLVFEL